MAKTIIKSAWLFCLRFSTTMPIHRPMVAGGDIHSPKGVFDPPALRKGLLTHHTTTISVEYSDTNRCRFAEAPT
jgi:hypothetical protein